LDARSPDVVHPRAGFFLRPADLSCCAGREATAVLLQNCCTPHLGGVAVKRHVTGGRSIVQNCWPFRVPKGPIAGRFIGRSPRAAASGVDKPREIGSAPACQRCAHNCLVGGSNAPGPTNFNRMRSRVIVRECSRSVHEYRSSNRFPATGAVNAHVATALHGTVNFFCLWFRRYIKHGFNLLKCFSGN
jgi:hypothetical protein